MPRRRVFALAGCLFAAFAGAQSATDARVNTSAPVRNYTVSFFSEEGYTRVRVQGGSADLSDRTAVRMEDVTLTVYTGGEYRAVEAILIAPLAILEPEPERVSGPDSVRLIRDDAQVEGEDWSYEHAERRIHVRRRAHVVFNTALTDILQ